MKRFLSGSFVPWTLALLFLASTLYLSGRLVRGGLGLGSSHSSRVDSAPIVMAVKKVARLATVELQVADVVRYEEVKTFLFVDLPKSATLRLKGRVHGGFDFDRGPLRVEADDARRTLKVTLPRAGIVALDPRIEWLDESSGFLNPVTPQDRNRWVLWANGALARAAKDAGLQARAEEHAKELIESTARAFGWSAEVQFLGAQPAL